MMTWFLAALGAFVSALLSLKLIEMFCHLAFVWRLPRAYVDSIGAAAGLWTKAGGAQLETLLAGKQAAWAPSQWLITGPILRMEAAPRLRWALLCAFRWPVLMGLQSLAVLTLKETTLIALGCALLVGGVWLQLLQRFVFRLRLGYLDSYFRAISARSLRAASHNVEPLHELDLVGDFVLLFLRLVVMVIFGYAAVFSAINRISPGAFGDLGDGVAADASLIYFSVVTIATVGYGDIVPKTLLARAVVTSEIMAGFALLVLLITAFALTASAPRPPGEGQ